MATNLDADLSQLPRRVVPEHDVDVVGRGARPWANVRHSSHQSRRGARMSAPGPTVIAFAHASRPPDLPARNATSAPASRRVLMPILDQRFAVVSPAAMFGRRSVAER